MSCTLKAMSLLFFKYLTCITILEDQQGLFSYSTGKDDVYLEWPHYNLVAQIDLSAPG